MKDMHVVAEYDVNEIINQVLETRKAHNPKPAVFIVDDVKYKVKLTSTRLRVFAESKICYACGIIGSVMRLEIDKALFITDPKKVHFNLYARRADGSLELMTQDHIIPRSYGGPTTFDNLKTMCHHCNNRRGNALLPDQHLPKSVFSNGQYHMIRQPADRNIRTSFMVGKTGQMNLISVYFQANPHPQRKQFKPMQRNLSKVKEKQIRFQFMSNRNYVFMKEIQPLMIQ